MNPRERRTRLLDQVRDGTGRIEELAGRFGVSPSTIRRDLAALARAGQVVRTYGGAVPELSPREKDAGNAAAKDAVAATAAGLVQDGEVVVLDAGTTTGRLAARLAHRRLTVVTNGLTVINALAGSPTVDLVVLGGRMRHPNEAIMGSSAIEQLRHIGADRVFLGADGLTDDRGVCCPSLEQAHLKHAMLHCARTAYVLADRSKLGHAPFRYWAPLDRPHTVVTEDPP